MSKYLELTDQQAFDVAWRHAVEDRAPASIKGGQCRYRAGALGTDPRRCFAGLFVPDGEYSPDMEGGTVMRPCVLDAAGIAADRATFFRGLQLCHDRIALSNDYSDRVEAWLRDFAAAHGLEAGDAARVERSLNEAPHSLKCSGADACDCFKRRRA